MTRARDLASGSGIEAGEVLPHIIPDVLYPAVANIMLDGTTSLSASTTGPNSSTVASSKYGTVQSDGRMYYYTDIKGSKPIKDPRIGAHFGSQRHKFKSLQKLEQETATHGENVYSVDGREWIRGNLKQVNNDNSGNYLDFTQDGFIEITGYWSSFNIIFYTADSTDQFKYQIDGATAVTSNLAISVSNPLHSRFVDAGSVHNLVTGQTLGIHTIKLIRDSSTYNNYFYGCELIAQDTSSTANKSKIQIPAQNVVSYGKKFAIPATAQHYDPFNGFTNGSSVTAYVDTATSLGIEAWKNSSTYYRPYNGGRVVKWVASDGTIKTSVNMMPPNAQNIAGSAISAKANASVANDTYLPTFSGAIDHSQAEVAKTFHNREFGNGNANGGTSGTYADASMLDGTQGSKAFVMDDGLTSLSGHLVRNSTGTTQNWTCYTDGYWHLTFIGTGFSQTSSYNSVENYTIAQNLPYGTHILKVLRDEDADPAVTLDGVSLGSIDVNNYGDLLEATIHQPKMPPIPEDAVVIADFMLMADYVANATAGLSNISKGVRRVGASRDVFYDQASGSWSIVNITVPQAFHSPFTESSTSAIAKSFKLPFFGNGLDRPFTGHSNKTATITPQFSVAGAAFANANAVSPSLTITSSSNSGTNAYNASTNVLSQNVGSDDSAQFVSYGNNLTLGVNEYKESSSASGYLNNSCLDIVSPVHSSSHYKSFSTPYLNELVGGDRNMEQTNLIVTPDGKSWDEVTRDTSYLGNMVLNISKDSGNVAENTVVVFDEILGFGTTASKISHFYKDFAIAYDRQICLVDGQYAISYSTVGGAAGSLHRASIYVNGLLVFDAYSNDTDHWQQLAGSISFNLKRGDYVQIKGGWFSANSSTQYSSYHIERV